MKIYYVKSSQWEEDEYFADKRSAMKRAKDAERNGDSVFAGWVEFKPTKKNILAMLNHHSYATAQETFYDSETK